GRQLAALLEAFAVAGEQPFIGHLGEQAFKGDAIVALDPEVARDLALAGLAAGGLQKRKDVVLGGQLPGAAAFRVRLSGGRRGGAFLGALFALVLCVWC